MGLDSVLELFAIAKNYCSNDTHSHGMAARKVQPAQQESSLLGNTDNMQVRADKAKHRKHQTSYWLSTAHY